MGHLGATKWNFQVPTWQGENLITVTTVTTSRGTCTQPFACVHHGPRNVAPKPGRPGPRATDQDTETRRGQEGNAASWLPSLLAVLLLSWNIELGDVLGALT